MEGNPPDKKKRSSKKDLSQSKSSSTIASRTEESVSLEFFESSGPIPAPNLLLAYETIQPGFAERILVMVEKEQAHRIEYDRVEQEATHNHIRRGHIMAFILAAMLMVAGVTFAFTGHPDISKIIFGGSIVGVAGLFLGSRILKALILKNKGK
ncbi:MAG: DUF2335 domain-containing protein [Salibacteraceae bacterium]